VNIIILIIVIFFARKLSSTLQKLKSVTRHDTQAVNVLEKHTERKHMKTCIRCT